MVVFTIGSALAPLNPALAAPGRQSAATLILQPSSGNPPSVSGSLGGSGWCTPARRVDVSGVGVTGDGFVGRDGTLNGSFMVTGSAGQVVTVQVTTYCDGSQSTGRANFTFNTPPPTAAPTQPPPTPTSVPSTSVPTQQPTATPTPIPTATVQLTAPPLLVETDLQGAFEVHGCSPQADQVSMHFLPLMVVEPGEEGAGQAEGPEFVVPVRPSAAAGVFLFDLPKAEFGRQYLVTAEVDAADCPPISEQPQPWMPGSSLVMPPMLPGSTELWMSSNGGKPPSGEINSFWLKEYSFHSTDKYFGRDQTFKWTTNMPDVDAGRLQASVFPFSSSQSAEDVNDPPGLVAEWDVTCVNCEFTIDLSPLSPEPELQKPANSSPNVIQLVKQFGASVQEQLIAWLQIAFSWFKPGSEPAQVAVADPSAVLPASVPEDSLVLAPLGNLAPTDFYFRIVPLREGEVAAALSDNNHIVWEGPPPDLGAVIATTSAYCAEHPTEFQCHGPLTDLYTLEVIAYHGFLPPVSGHIGCFIATKTTKLEFPTSYSVPAGTPFCPPEPESKGILEAIADFVADVVNFASGLYKDFKGALVSAVADLIPGDIPSEAMLGLALDAALASAGIPPSLPNFNQLVNEGIDYLAAEVASQAGIPPELTQQLQDQGIPTDLIDQKAQEFIQDQVKQGIQAGLEQAQYALGNSVSFVPNGVPVKPDPQGAWQPPTMILRITRTGNWPDTGGACGSGLMTSSELVAQQTAAFDRFNASNDPGNGPDLQLGKAYQLFQDTYNNAVPALEQAGQSVDIPIVLKPALKWGTYQGYFSYDDATSAWAALSHSGDAEFEIQGACAPTVQFTWDADGTYQK